MDRTLLGVAAVLAAAALLVFSGGYLVRSVPQAEAQDLGPVFSGGGMPLLFFSGTHNRRTTTPSAVYTVPAGKTFVMTAACLSQTYLSVISDYSSTDVNYMCSAGNGQIPFASGSVVGVAGTCPSCSNSSYAYALQGYLVAN
jgi:hypothetical protein